MLTVNRRPGPPIDQGISVIVDLPHITELPARPHLCSIMRADTHDPIRGVLGVSMHFDTSPSAGNYELWLVAEQLVDANGAPLPVGHRLEPELHHEYFSQALRTGLFRYRVAGFTAGPLFDRATGLHRDLAPEVGKPNTTGAATNLTVFQVTFKNLFETQVEAHYFEYGEGFVTFYADGFRAAAYNAGDVLSVRTIPGKRVFVVNDAQLRVLRSAVLWDTERTAASAEPSEYRQALLDVLVDVLGVMPPSESHVNECAAAGEAPDEDDADEERDEPNERTQRAARQLDGLVARA